MEGDNSRKKVDFSKFSNSFYKPGSFLKRTLWYFTDWFFFKTLFPWPYGFKAWLLRLFGAKIGKGVVIKPDVHIKYPWFLEMGDNVWIGERVWIDNLAKVKIGDNVCFSQDVYIVAGGHNYKKESFDLILEEITIEDGVWVAARCIITPGVKIASHSVILTGSVLTQDTKPYGIYQGNPAVFKRERIIE